MYNIYTIYYPGSNVTQEKILIPHYDYLKFKVLPTDSDEEEERKKLIKREITRGIEFFTDESPLYLSIETGIMNCNGIWRTEIKLKI